MAFLVTIIIGKFVLAVIQAVALWFWQTIIGFIGFFYQLALKYFGNVWGIVLAAFMLLFAGTVIMQQFQEPIWQTADATYNVVVLPPAEVSISFAYSGPRAAYEEVAPRWNDLVYMFGDAFRALVNDLASLPGFDQVGFYTGIPRAIIRFLERVTFLMFDTESWQIPFGISSLLSSFWRYNWCIFKSAAEFIFRFFDYTLIRNDPIFCELDPNATCLFRQVPNFFPFLFVGHVEPTLTGLENCTNGTAVDCEFITCTIRAFSNFSAPFSNIPGAPNLTAFYEDVIPDVCCVITRSYKVPFWVFQGFLSFCITPGQAADQILNDGFIAAANCFVDLIFKLSGDVIADVFLDIFAIIFPFIQEVVDGIEDLFFCYSTFNSCFSSYPSNCNLLNNGVANGGLQTCFSMAGDCVVNGITGVVPPNPIFSVTPFDVTFQTILPATMQFIDTVVCNFEAFLSCFSGPDQEDCPSDDVEELICQLQCVSNRAAGLRPLTDSFRAVVSFFDSSISALESAVDAIESGGGITDELMKEGGKGKFIHTPERWFYGTNEGENNETTFSFTNYTELLEYAGVEQNTTCGKVLYKIGVNFEEKSISNFNDIESNLYYPFWVCNYLFISGLNLEKKYFGELKATNFLDVSTAFGEFSKLFQFKRKEIRTKIEEKYGKEARGNETGLTVFQRMFANQTSQRLREFSRADDYNKALSLSYIDIGNKTEHQLWSERVRENIVGGFKDISLGIFERMMSHDVSVNTLTFYEMNKMIRDTQFKLIRKIPGKIFESERRKRLSRGSITQKSTFGVTTYIHNYTIADLIPENDHSLQIMKEKLDALEVLFNESGPFQKGRIERHLQGMREEIYAEFVTNIVNYIQGVYEEKRMLGIVKKQISQHNSRLGLQAWYEILPNMHKTRVVTVEDLKRRREHVTGRLTKVHHFLESLYELGEFFFPDKEAVRNIMKWPVLNDIPFARSLHIFLNNDYTDSELIKNFTKYQTGELSYIIEKGFVEPSEFEEFRKKTRSSITFIRDWWTGTYDPRAERMKSHNTSLFGMDYNAPSKYLGGLHDLWRQLAKEHRYREMQKRNITDFNSEEAKTFKVSVNLPGEVRKILDFFSYILNTVFGTIFKIFFNVDINFDLEKILCDWIDSFDPQEEAIQGATNIFDFFKRLFICRHPENVNGEEVYKFSCFPFVPEGLFRGWTDPVGKGNPYFPLQPEWPVELIKKPCVNTFNGESNFWAPWRLSDNCGSNDGQDRPLCDILDRDWCRREFFTCTDIGFDSPVKSIAFVGGEIPVLLQEFFTGVIGVTGLSMFLAFLYIHILNFGSLNVAFAPWIVFPAVFGYYFILNFFDSAFQGLSGEGERGGIPYGFIYVLGLVVITYLAPPALNSMPQVIKVFVLWGLALMWIINLVFPFRGVRENFVPNQWIVSILKFIDNTPQFFEFIPLGSAIDAFEQFDYSQKPVPYVDVFCWFSTISNFFIFFVAAFVFVDLVNFLIYVFYPTFIFIVALIRAIMQLWTDIRYWKVKQDTSDNTERIDRLENEIVQKFAAFKIQTRENFMNVTGGRPPVSPFEGRISKTDDDDEQFYVIGEEKNDGGGTRLRKRRRVSFILERLDTIH